MSARPMRLGIAAESRATATLVTGLADRVVLERVRWIDPEHLPHHREWVGVDRENFLDLHSARNRAREQGLRVYGHFSGEPGAPDAQMVRAILLLFAHDSPVPDLVLVARDVDGKTARVNGARQAVESPKTSRNVTNPGWPFPVVLALAQPEVEAWQILAAAPIATDEAEKLKAIRRELGFDPTIHPEKLTSKEQMDPKDAKRVLSALCSVGRTPPAD